MHNNIIEVEQIFEVEKENNEKSKRFEQLPNRTLLWHGSKMINFGSILRNGLKLEPDDVETTGSFFGLGLYFTEILSKATGYSRRPATAERGLVLLCEVALGESYEVNDFLDENFTAANLQKGKNSVKTIGRNITSSHIELENGIILPAGPVKVISHVAKTKEVREFVVFSEDQCRIRNVLQVKFVHKDKIIVNPKFKPITF